VILLYYSCSTQDCVLRPKIYLALSLVNLKNIYKEEV